MCTKRLKAGTAVTGDEGLGLGLTDGSKVAWMLYPVKCHDGLGSLRPVRPVLRRF